MIYRHNRWYQPLSDFLSEYKELNIDNHYRPVAVGRYGIRTRESIYSKELAKDYSKNRVIRKNTLTVGMGSTQMDIGILVDDIAYSVSPAYHTYRISGIDPVYLDYCLQCRNQDMFLRFMKRGSRQGKSIDLDRWITYEIPVYPPDVQMEIVDRLSATQRVIASRRREIDQLDMLIKAQFVEMFCSHRRWQEKAMEEVCKQIKRYPTFCNMEYIDSGVRVIRIGNILADGHMDTDEANYVFVYEDANRDFPDTVIQENDIVMAVRGDGSTAKRIGIVTEGILIGANISPNLIRIQADSNQILPTFLFSFLTSAMGQQRLEKYVNKTAKKNIAAKDICKVLLPVPPIKEQLEFVKMAVQVDKSKVV